MVNQTTNNFLVFIWITLYMHIIH